jgi:hypothetical protein
LRILVWDVHEASAVVGRRWPFERKAEAYSNVSILLRSNQRSWASSLTVAGGTTGACVHCAGVHERNTKLALEEVEYLSQQTKPF